MKKIIKRFVFMALVISQSLPIWAQTEYGMSLGKMKFIQAPSSMKIEARTMKISMSRSVITPRICARVGGVAFVQVAEPEFEVKTVYLSCDNDSNAAFAVINGQSYRIPLDVWQLQPIVNYANDDNNAIVTLFGKGDCKIQFHASFIDNLLGLRLLQTDLLLASNYLDVSDRWKLPSNSSGEYVMAESEKEEYETDTLLYRLLYETSYDTMSLYASLMINKAMDSIGEQMSTYIYTDFGEKITFNVEDNKLHIKGNPYYRFTSNDSILDTLETYPEVLSFMDTLVNKMSQYKQTIARDVYAIDVSPKMKELKRIVSNNYLDDESKAAYAINVLEFNKISDSICGDGFNLYALCNFLLVNRLSKYIDSIEFNGQIVDPEQTKLFYEIKEVIKDSSIYDSPALSEYARVLFTKNPSDSILISIGKLFELTTFSIEDLMIYHINRNGIRKAVFAEGLTAFLKENNELVYLLNPIVVRASQNTCKWSAFFRYVKAKNPRNWKSFVKQVASLRYDAPKVYTPIRLEYSE